LKTEEITKIKEKDKKRKKKKKKKKKKKLHHLIKMKLRGICG
jgi:hypothetical protein